MIWMDAAHQLPQEATLVLATGLRQGKEGADRWVYVAQRVIGDHWINDATGEELTPPTHWQEVPALP